MAKSTSNRRFAVAAGRGAAAGDCSEAVGATRVDPPGRDPAAARRLVAAALEAEPDGVELAPDAAGELLACYGVRLWPGVVLC